MKQTAVEWLEDFLASHCNPVMCNVDFIDFELSIKKAKEMEKQQIIDATIYGNRQEFYDGTEMIGNEYYNETFKKK